MCTRVGICESVHVCFLCLFFGSVCLAGLLSRYLEEMMTSFPTLLWCAHTCQYPTSVSDWLGMSRRCMTLPRRHGERKDSAWSMGTRVRARAHTHTHTHKYREREGERVDGYGKESNDINAGTRRPWNFETERCTRHSVRPLPSSRSRACMMPQSSSSTLPF